MTRMRVGHGFDIHRLEPLAPAGGGRPLRLGGVAFDSDLGTVAHSDGDAVLHAVADAILGALGEPDLGSLFPDTEPANAGRDSAAFIAEAVRRMRARQHAIGNLDVTVICQQPAIAPRRNELRAAVAALLGCEAARVNVKGKTHEGVDAVGERRAIAVHAVALLVSDRPAPG